jgi:hypothetical protein
MAEIKSESVADFIPESLADLLRNQQPLDCRRDTHRTAKASATCVHRLDHGFLVWLTGCDRGGRSFRDLILEAVPVADGSATGNFVVDSAGRAHDHSARSSATTPKL